MTDKRGGKRAGAGRPKGATSVPAELRNAAQAHTQDALSAIVEIMQDTSHPQRLRAAETILERGYGKAGEFNLAEGIIQRFLADEITAIQAGLLFEAQGLKVPDMIQRYIDNEIRLKEEEVGFSVKTLPLPKS